MDSATIAYQEIGQTLAETTRRAAPRFKYNAGLRGRWENGLSGEIAYHWIGAVTYPLSQRFVDFQPFGVIPPDAYVGSYHFLNLRGAYRSGRKQRRPVIGERQRSLCPYSTRSTMHTKNTLWAISSAAM